MGGVSGKEQVTNQASDLKKQKKKILLDLTWKNEPNAAGPSDFRPRLGQLRKDEASQCKSGDWLIFLGWPACLVDPKQIIPPPPWVHTRPPAELCAVRFLNN